MSICLLDTSILCELLKIPDRCQRSDEIRAELLRKAESETLLLPISAVVETGNHIGQIKDGRLRRDCAKQFVALVQQAFRGETPFTATSFFERDELLEWIDTFPEWATHGSGFADLTIFKEFERQCQLHQARRVYIWSRDKHLSSYDRAPQTTLLRG